MPLPFVWTAKVKFRASRVDFIVAARRSGVRCDCRVGGRPATASLAFERGAAAVALDVHFEDGGVMNEAVDDSDCHCLVREDFAHSPKGWLAVMRSDRR